MIERVVGVVFPIYAVVAAGHAYGRWKKPGMAFANQLSMDIFVPPMMFKNSGNMGLPLAVLAFGEAGQPAAVVLVAPVPNHLPGLTGRDAAMFILFGALPPAVLNCLVAERYRQEPERVASIVLIGNLASLAIIPLTLAWVL